MIYPHIRENPLEQPKKIMIKNNESRILLGVQWLRIRLPMQGTWVPSLVGEPRSCMPRGN